MMSFSPGQKYRDTIKDIALQKDLKPLLNKVKYIKKLLALPEIRAKMYKEVFGKRLITGDNRPVLAAETKVLT